MRAIVFLVIMLAISSFCPGQWMQIPTGETAALWDVQFPDSSLGFAVGSNGLVLKSNDWGDSWQRVHLDSSKYFQSVFFTSADTGYAAGGKLYRTVDGGLSWTTILTDTFDQIMEVYFVNSNVGFASGTKLYRTFDGAATWDTLDLNNVFSCIFFPSYSIGYFIGGPDSNTPLYKTLDGGQNFLPITNGFQSIKEATHFLNDSVGYLCGWYGDLIAKTINGGMSWQMLNSPQGNQCWDLFFQDENIGYYIDNGGGYNRILKTVDGGQNWNVQLSRQGLWLHAFLNLGPDMAIVVGDSGSIFKTTNGGGLGMEASQFDDFLEIFPNPFSSTLTVVFPMPMDRAKVEIFDMQGNLKRHYQIQGELELVIERGDLASGAYFLRLNFDSGDLTQAKLILVD